MGVRDNEGFVSSFGDELVNDPLMLSFMDSFIEEILVNINEGATCRTKVHVQTFKVVKVGSVC